MNFNRCFFYNRCCFSPDYSMYSPTNIIRLSLSIRLFAFHLPLVLTFFIDYWENFVSCYSTWNIFKCSSPIRKKKEREWNLCKDQFPQRNETNPYLIAFKTIRIHVVSKFKFVGSRGWGRDTCCFFFILHRNSRHPVYPTLVNNSTLYIWIPLTYPACHLGNLHSPFYATRTHAHARARARGSLRAHASFICASNTRSGRTLWEYVEPDAHGFFSFCLCGATSDLMGVQKREREAEVSAEFENPGAARPRR